MKDDVLPDVLQAFEYTLTAIDRLSQVVRQFIDAERRGLTLPDHVLRAYVEQLDTVASDRQRLAQSVDLWWQVLGRNLPH